MKEATTLDGMGSLYAGNSLVLILRYVIRMM